MAVWYSWRPDYGTLIWIDLRSFPGGVCRRLHVSKLRTRYDILWYRSEGINTFAVTRDKKGVAARNRFALYHPSQSMSLTETGY